MHCDNQRKLRAKVVGQKQQQSLRCNHELCDNQRNLWEKVVGQKRNNNGYINLETVYGFGRLTMTLDAWKIL